MPRVPQIDETLKRLEHQVIGNAGDSPVQTSGNTTNSIVALLKGILDILTGTTGISTWKAGLAPGNGVSLSEAVRFIADAQAGTVGLATFPAGAAPANDVSLAEVIRYIADAISSDTGLATFPAAVLPANGVSLAEAIRYIADALHGDAGLAAFPAGVAPANGTSLAEGIRYIAEGMGVRSAQTALLAATPTGNTDLFTITGSIRLLSILGIVQTTAMAAAQTQLKLTATPDALAATDLCAALDVTGDVVGTTYNITGTVANALVAVTTGVAIAQAGMIIIPATTSAKITLNNADAENAGQTLWQVLYQPIEPNALVAAA